MKQTTTQQFIAAADASRNAWLREQGRADQAVTQTKLREAFMDSGMSLTEAAYAAAGPYGTPDLTAPTPAIVARDAWDRLAESMGEGPQFAAAMRKGRA